MIRPKTTRSRRSRLADLEEVVLEVYDPGPTGPISAPECYEFYRDCGKAGLLAREPDFEATLAEFYRRLEIIPPERHVPTEDFEPDKPERERLRLWQIRQPIQELQPLYRKLHAMMRRASLDLEGVSEAEYAQKNAWFKQHIDDLPMHYMIARDGETSPRNNTIETALYQGATSEYAHTAMVTLREWEKGNYDKTNTYGEWRRKREQQK